jgi:mono/diheme cytochrome c family protein
MRKALAGIVAVTLVLAGCGGSGGSKDRRAAVNQYFDQVDHVEAILAGASGQINQTFARYSLARMTPSELHQLAYAEQVTHSTLVRIRRLSPPPEAAAVQRDLLRLNGLQFRVAHELVWTARDLPRFSDALVPLQAAGRTLGHDISSAAGTPAKAQPGVRAPGGAGLWARSGCGGCHTLAAAGAKGTTGPSLDQLHPTAAQIAAQLRSGGPGMKSYSRTLSPSQISTLATFVASSETAPRSTDAMLEAFASAFSRYGDSLASVLQSLRPLDPPPVLKPTVLAERRVLSQSVALCALIAQRLHNRQVDAANAAIRKLFLTVATGVAAADDRRAESAAMKAYNARVAAMDALSSRVERDRVEVARKLG